MHASSAATGTLLRLRAQLLARIRDFFAERSVLEVETPALSLAGISDPAIDSVQTELRQFTGTDHYLHTSPEYAMKRLLVEGAGDIYQLCRVFRDGELGRWHQPEFTLLEWYRVAWDEHELMKELEALLRALLSERAEMRASVSLTYAEAFSAYLGCDPYADVAAISDKLQSMQIDVPQQLDRNALLDLALSTAIVPQFEPATLTFIYDYPASQAALAEIKVEDPPVAARFEAFLGGIELANGFRELTDAAEQRRRFEAELATRRAAGRSTAPLDEAFLSALARGLPACAGVAVGVDRVLAIAAGTDDIAAVINFPHRS